jgi:bilirubin oxidase
MHRREFVVLGAAAGVAVLAGCGGAGMTGTPSMGTMPAPAASPPAPTPPPAASALVPGQSLAALVRLANTSSSPNEFVSTLVAQPARKTMLAGTSTEFWTYNGLVPGPLVEVFEGDTVRILLENRLMQETTVHWHGLPVPSDQDGNPMDPVAPGRNRLYEFALPPGSAGTYWYHPHPHELTAEQVFRGMAGLLVVRSRTDPVPATIEEKLLVISDLRLASDGTIPPNSAMDWQSGREGDYLLVNGQYQPVLSIAPGQSQRWRILNATNARYLRLALSGHTMTLIGTDGGLLRAPRPGLDEILLAPAERIEVVVTGGLSSGATGVLRALPYDRGGMAAMGVTAAPIPVLTLSYGGPAAPAIALPGALASVPALGAPVATKRLVFSSAMRAGATGMNFLIDGKSFDPARVDLISRIDEVELWSIENRSDMDHPFHLHGTQFQVVSRTRGGVTTMEPYVAWRDTVNVAAFETVALKTVQRQRGKRLYHCHILEHESRGMMGVLEVVA